MRISFDESGPLACLSIRLISSAHVVPLLQAAGFRAIYVDLQHSSISAASAVEITAHADRLGMHSFIRTSGPRVAEIVSLASLGAKRILIPGADTAPQAHQLMNELAQHHYFHGAAGHGVELGLMVESVLSVSDIEAIMRLPNLSFAMIGCTDLKKDVATVGIADTRYICNAIRRVAAAAKSAKVNIMVGGTWRSEELLNTALSVQPSLITVGSDLLLLEEGTRVAAEKFAAAARFRLKQSAGTPHKSENDH
jgi:2-keto-3-deoxy-L-rhamnonate aldolase RhmA